MRSKEDYFLIFQKLNNKQVYISPIGFSEFFVHALRVTMGNTGTQGKGLLTNQLIIHLKHLKTMAKV